jgi:hypothetical protein
MVIRARDNRTPSAATALLGEPAASPTTPPAVKENSAGRSSTAARKKVASRRSDKQRRVTSGRNLAFGSSSGGASYPPPLPSGGGSGTYPPANGGSSTASNTSSSGGGGNGGGGDQEPEREPQPVGSEATATLPLYYHWSDDGHYFFTTDRDASMEALSDYDHRVQLGTVWSSSKPGDDLEQLCLTGERCEGYVAEKAPRAGSYKVLYWHPGGEDGRFFSTNPSATYRGQALSVYGYIR